MKIWKIAQYGDNQDFKYPRTRDEVAEQYIATHPNQYSGFVTMQEHIEEMERQREGKHAYLSLQDLQTEVKEIQQYIDMTKKIMEVNELLGKRKNPWYTKQIKKYTEILNRIAPILEEKRLDQMEIDSRT